MVSSLLGTIGASGGTAVPCGIGTFTSNVGKMLFPSPPPIQALRNGCLLSVTSHHLAIGQRYVGPRLLGGQGDEATGRLKSFWKVLPFGLQLERLHLSSSIHNGLPGDQTFIDSLPLILSINEEQFQCNSEFACRLVLTREWKDMFGGVEQLRCRDDA